MFPFYFRRRHSKVDDDVEAITAKRDPAGPPRVLPRGHLGKEFHNHSHELTYITPFEKAQRWMGKNTFPILLLNDNMIGEH